ncbi:MAG: sugar isomerase domain-containing protein [Verrucomicrobiota bacterium]|nr:sugar isomerase domain-containing protein [Verrucomicrobiota bacterium]
MDLSGDYYSCITRLLETVRERNLGTIRTVAPLIGANMAAGGILHTFGSGHSAIISQEMVHRAGGLVPISQIGDPSGGMAENLPGYGRKLAERYQALCGMQAGEFIIVTSNSGKNASPIDVALFAKERGLKVLGICSLEVAKNNRSEHPSGQRLFEVADYALDNCSVTGDAAIIVPGAPVKAGPTSTFAGALLLNLLHLEIITYFVQNGLPPPLLQSANTPGGKEHNAALAVRFQHRLSHVV